MNRSSATYTHANKEAQRVARAVEASRGEWCVYRVRHQTFAALADKGEHALHRQHVHQLRLGRQYRRKIRQFLADLVLTRRMEEVTAALDVLLLDVRTTEVGHELVQLAESGQLDMAVLDQVVDHIIVEGGRRRQHRFEEWSGDHDWEGQISSELARALQQLVTREVQPGIFKRGRLFWGDSLYERIVFLDMCADAAGIPSYDCSEWVSTLQERGWLPAVPDRERHRFPDPRRSGPRLVNRWRFTEIGRREWAKMRKSIVSG